MMSFYALISSVSSFCGVIGGSGTKEGLSLTNSSDGGYVLAGYLYSSGFYTYVVKLDSLMNTQWSKILNFGSGNAVIQNFRGNYIVVGSYGVMEMDPDGNVLWKKKIQVFSTSHISGDSVISGTFYSVIQSSDSGYFLIGTARAYYEPDYAYGHILIVKIDRNGNVLWHTLYSPYGAGDFYAYRAYPTSDGGFVLITGGMSVIISKFDQNGFHQFSRDLYIYAVGYGPFYTFSVAQAGNGYYYFSYPNYYFGKMTPSGDILWIKDISPIETRQIVPTYDKGYLVLGWYGHLMNPRIAIIKFDSLDQVEWAEFLGDSAYAYSAIQTPDSGFAIIGSKLNSYTGSDIFFVKVDKNGDLCSPCGRSMFSLTPGGFTLSPYTQYPVPFTETLRIDSLGTISNGLSMYPICFSSDISEISSKVGVGITISCDNITLKYDGAYEVVIYGVSGRTIIRERLYGNGTIDISNLRKGIYKLTVKTDEGKFNYTFIKP